MKSKSLIKMVVYNIDIYNKYNISKFKVQFNIVKFKKSWESDSNLFNGKFHTFNCVKYYFREPDYYGKGFYFKTKYIK